MNRIRSLKPKPLLGCVEYNSPASCFKLEVGNPAGPLPLDTSTFSSHGCCAVTLRDSLLLFRSASVRFAIVSYFWISEERGGPRTRRCPILQPSFGPVTSNCRALTPRCEMILSCTSSKSSIFNPIDGTEQISAPALSFCLGFSPQANESNHPIA